KRIEPPCSEVADEDIHADLCVIGQRQRSEENVLAAEKARNGGLPGSDLRSWKQKGRSWTPQLDLLDSGMESLVGPLPVSRSPGNQAFLRDPASDFFLVSLGGVPLGGDDGWEQCSGWLVELIRGRSAD